MSNATDTQINRQINREINRQINREINRQINREMDLYILKHIDRLDGLCCGDIDTFDSNDVCGFTMNDVKKRASEIKEYRKELDVLLQLPLMKQRTEEWYEARKTRLTASDLYDAIKGNNVSIKLAKKKANIVVDTINYNGIPALKWGTMFEPMATRCYSQKMNDIAIHDFGLVCDTENEHFGASPDGINELGIMLEIKCPYSRKIEDGVIPEKYKMQIQGQLAVCKLKECDYIECVFKSLDSVEEYLALDCDDGNGNDIKHGVIAEYYNSKGEYVYYYSEANRTPKECVDDICGGCDNINPDKSLKFSKYTYWRLDEMIIQRVVFNAKAWETIVPKINAFWESVEEYKSLPLLPIETGMKKYMFVKDDD
uniref:YqaJ viral recombinase domain-containing protein n=1 Tax=viral metagenome TaxID=1070528 RepID=A0A6C0LKQ7_9ZZZZ